MTTGTPWLRRFFRFRTGQPPQLSTTDTVPENVSIQYDRLLLILNRYIASIEHAARWSTYAGAAFSLWGTLAVTDFPSAGTKFGLTGGQWQLIFIIAAIWTSARALYGVFGYVRRPKLQTLLGEIVGSADITKEFRALCLLKARGSDHEFRVLVYRDPLWDCYLLPHHNMLNTTIGEADDPTLCQFVAGFVGVPKDGVRCNYIVGADLKSRKHSEFYRQGTLYRFSFYLVQLADGPGLPNYLMDRDFSHNGRSFAWLTISEMEADYNTRNRNLDVTRHLADNAYSLFSVPPDSLPSGSIRF